MDRTVCELFAGVGGFRLGLEHASPKWKTVWFSQWEPNKKKQWAHDCYVAHWGDIDERTGIDIALVDKKDIPDHNLLVGGFPCQDYSVARPLPGSTGIEGKKGVLWWQIRDILQVKRPPFSLFENVDRLLKSPASQRGRDFGIILAWRTSVILLSGVSSTPRNMVQDNAVVVSSYSHSGTILPMLVACFVSRAISSPRSACSPVRSRSRGCGPYLR